MSFHVGLLSLFSMPGEPMWTVNPKRVASHFSWNAQTAEAACSASMLPPNLAKARKTGEFSSMMRIPQSEAKRETDDVWLGMSENSAVPGHSSFVSCPQ
jgi:hypothetical protein